MEPETKARDQPPKAAMDQRASNTAGVLKVKEVEAEVVVVGGSEEAPLLAHPWCSLLQLLLRTCGGCLGLHGYCSDNDLKPPVAADDDGLKPVADDDAAAPAVVAETPREGARGGGDEAASEVGARVRKPTPPGPPKGGSGDDGGKHN